MCARGEERGEQGKSAYRCVTNVCKGRRIECELVLGRCDTSVL